MRYLALTALLGGCMTPGGVREGLDRQSGAHSDMCLWASGDNAYQQRRECLTACERPGTCEDKFESNRRVW